METISQARTVTAVSAVVSAVALSRMVARWRMRHVIWLGAAIAAGSSVAIACSLSAGMFIAAHALSGAAVALLLSASFAGAATVGGAAARAVGLVAGANSLAWVLFNPLAGLLAQSASWRLAFLIPAAAAVGCTLLTMFIPSNAAPTPADRSSILSLLRVPPVRGWIIAEVMAYCGWTVILTFVGPFFVQEQGLAVGVAGLVLGIGSASFFITSSQSARFATLAAPSRLIALTSFALAGLSVILFAISGNPWTAIAAFFLAALIAGVRTPAATLRGAALSPTHANQTMTSRTAVTQLGYLVGAVGGGLILATTGYPGLAALVVTGLIASGYLHWRSGHTTSSKASR